jgi:predicted Zn-dependent protease
MRASVFQLTIITMLFAGNAWSHDNAQACGTTAANSPALEAARSELKERPKSVPVRVDLADKLVGVGCYDEAVHTLEDGLKLFPNDRHLQTKLRTAKSFIGEREYLDKQPVAAAGTDAAFLRAQLRCKQIGDLAACDQAILAKPNEAALWAAKGDAFLKEKRAREALVAFNRAQQLNAVAPSDIDVTSRVNAAQALLAVQSPPSIASSISPRDLAPLPAERIASASPPVAKHSNVEPASRSN